jgi:archaellum biogenesis ATPase FlaH
MKSNNQFSVFKVQELNEVIETAKLEPTPRKLFGSLWFESEICILFSDTNTGKSILALQIADGITNGSSSIPILATEVPAQAVLYLDFELIGKHYQVRYSDKDDKSYQFSKKLYRVEIDYNQAMPKGMSLLDVLRLQIRSMIEQYDAKIIIIDNLTYLNDDLQKASSASVLLKDLRELKIKYGLSILIVAHTPKLEAHAPITVNSLAGSKMLANLCDSAFAIGKCVYDPSIRYVKQLKCRFDEIKYDLEVPTFKLEKKEGKFLSFNYLGIEKEKVLLNDKDENEELESRVFELHEQGKTQREIADIVVTNLSKVNRILKKK